MRKAARRLLKALTRDRSGAAALDFAIVSLPLFLFLFGVAEFSRAIWIEEALQNTASDVARCAGLPVQGGSYPCAASGATTYSSSLTTTRARYTAGKWGVSLAGQDLTLATTNACPGMPTGATYVSVSLSYPFSTVAKSLIPALTSKTLTAQACFPMS